MKKVISPVDNDDCGITAGKQYIVTPKSLSNPDICGEITTDTGITIFITFKNSAHIEFNDWSVKDA